MPASEMTIVEVRALEVEISRAKVMFYEKNGKYPTRIFLDRASYLKLVVTRPFLDLLNKDRSIYGMELFQAVPIFGSPDRKLLEVLE